MRSNKFLPYFFKCSISLDLVSTTCLHSISTGPEPSGQLVFSASSLQFGITYSVSPITDIRRETNNVCALLGLVLWIILDPFPGRLIWSPVVHTYRRMKVYFNSHSGKVSQCVLVLQTWRSHVKFFFFACPEFLWCLLWFSRFSLVWSFDSMVIIPIFNNHLIEMIEASVLGFFLRK